MRVDVIAQDLTTPTAAAEVRAETDRRGIRVDILVNNAGFASAGRFHEIPADRLHQEVALDVSALVDLTAAYLPDLTIRSQGRIINVASTVAYQPTPFLAVYGAAKAFVLSFSQALREECRGLGVKVTVVCPGPVDTGFLDVVGTREARVGRARPISFVVERALRAAERNRPVITPGLENALVPVAARLLPRWLVVRATGRGLRGTTRSPSPASIATADVLQSL